MMPYKVAFVSLGCAKNLVNTEQMMALCRDAGHTVTGDPEGADVAVLNTCGFIESAKSEAIENILELSQLKDQGKLKKLLVAGCLTQRYPDDIRKELPEVDGMLGTGSYTDVVTAVEELMAGEHPEHFERIDRAYDDGERMVTTPPYTAYLKIAEGCSNGCAFCIIPKLRGRYRSRTMDSLLREARELEARGTRMQSWAPFTEGRRDLFAEPVLQEIGAAHGKTAAQTALRYLIQNGIGVIPKSSHRARMEENFALFDFALTAAGR